MPEYRSPQNEPGMERNLLLVFLLMAVVVFGSQFFLRKYAPQTKSTAQPTQPIQAPAPSTPLPLETKPAPTVAPGKQSQARQAASESEITVENDVYRLTFTNRGAQVKSWILKKFTD